MNEPIIFLDIDGVLNGHYWEPDRALIDNPCVKRFNSILNRTGASVVLSSAWRYQILHGATTLLGFRYLLVSHGVNININIVDHTLSDEEITAEMGGRTAQILSWVEKNNHKAPWVVLDDLPLGEDLKDYHVRTDSSKGLTDDDVEKAVAVIERKYFWPDLTSVNNVI